MSDKFRHSIFLMLLFLFYSSVGQQRRWRNSSRCCVLCLSHPRFDGPDVTRAAMAHIIIPNFRLQVIAHRLQLQLQLFREFPHGVLSIYAVGDLESCQVWLISPEFKQLKQDLNATSSHAADHGRVDSFKPFYLSEKLFFYLPSVYVSLRAPEWPLITFGLLYLHFNQACVFSWIPFSRHSFTIICHPTSNKLIHKNLKSAKLKLFLHTTKTTSSLCKLDHFLAPDCSDFAHFEYAHQMRVNIQPETAASTVMHKLWHLVNTWKPEQF